MYSWTQCSRSAWHRVYPFACNDAGGLTHWCHSKGLYSARWILVIFWQAALLSAGRLGAVQAELVEELRRRRLAEPNPDP